MFTESTWNLSALKALVILHERDGVSYEDCDTVFGIDGTWACWHASKSPEYRFLVMVMDW